MEKKLYRNENDKVVAGVCSGLAEYFEMDVTWIRIGFVLAAVFGASGLLVYIIMWIAVPRKEIIPFYNPYQNTDYKVYENTTSDSPRPAYGGINQTGLIPDETKKSNRRMVAGLFLVALGAYLLMDEFNILPDWVEFEKLWPLIIIIPGILIVSKAGRKSESHIKNPEEEIKSTEVKLEDQPLA